MTSDGTKVRRRVGSSHVQRRVGERLCDLVVGNERSHTMPDGIRQPLSSSRFVLPRGSKVEKEIRRTVERTMKASLGLKSNQKLPADVAALVSSTSVAAASKAVELQATKTAEEAAREFGKVDVLARFDNKARLAQQGIAHISKSNDVDEILKKRAEMLAAKKAALEAAKFTSDEAMSILLADIAARGH